MTTPRVPSNCSQCGAELPFAVQFCSKCGTPAGSKAAPVAAPIAAPLPSSDAPGLTNYTRVRELYDKALLVGPPWNDPWLQEACGGDPTLMAELKGMLSVKQTSFLSQPAPVLADFQSLAPAPRQVPSQWAQTQIMIGPYRVLRELGRGGMGVVYLATRDDGTFRKNVALKLLLREHVNDEFVQRFKQERQVLAALDHPNIARILDGGDTPDGAPYYVMDYVEGVPIDVFCDQARLSLGGRIKTFQQVCHAVDYLHQNSIVHRDLKPSNIMVSTDGTVKLLDFGIAKVIGAGAMASPDLTSSHGAPMTLSYASPEQILGKPLKNTSDIYSLGVILYRLLTGRMPYDAEEKTARVTARQDPPRPSANIREDLKATETTVQLRRAMMGELDSIVLMSLRFDSSERYESGADFADDLQRFLDGQPVKAHRGSVVGRSLKLLKRKRVAAAVAVAFVLVSGFGGWQLYRVQTQKAEVAKREGEIRGLLDQLEGRLGTDSADAAQQPVRPPAEQIEDVKKLKQIFRTDYTAMAARGPGKSPERAALLERGVRYLDRLHAAAPSDPSLNLEIADAYQEIGVLHAQTTGNDAASRQAALKTYQKAAAVLTANPDDARAADQLKLVNQRIQALGGPAVATGAPAVDPAAAPPGQPATAAPPVSEPPKPAAVVTPAVATPPPSAAPPPQAAPPPAPVPAAAPPVQTPPPAAAPANTGELDEEMITAESKVQTADQAIEPFRQSLARSGQGLSPDIVSAASSMHVALARAKRQIAAGNMTAAKESLSAAEALAAKVLRSVGR